MAKITVLGSGGFGLSLAIMCSKNGHQVSVWSTFKDEIDTLKADHEHKTKLPNVKIPENILLTNSLDCINGSDIVIFGIPSAFVRNVAKQVTPYITKDMVVVNTGKGLEDGTHLRLSVVLQQELPNANIVVLSGPSHAEEVARDIPTTVAVASNDVRYAEYVQEVLSNPLFRIYVSTDIIGCELGGSLKNIIALCAGISDGLGFGDNTKAALMTRGICEIVRLGVALGANVDTFSGLTGIGDLIVTCTSMHSRNRRAGILIGKGYTKDEAMKEVQMVVEGVFSAKAALELSKKYNIEMPIVEQVNKVLFEDKPAAEAVKELMLRDKKIEIDNSEWK